MIIREKKFAEGLCFFKLFWIFVFGSFLGWLYETIIALFQFGEIVSRRGLIFGPFNPVYGFGIVLMVLILSRFKSKLLLFILGSFLGGFFEYTIWALQKAIFHSESWNYQSPIVIDGKVIGSYFFWGGTSFFHALGWGILIFLLIKIIYPLISKVIEKFNEEIGSKITYFMIILLCVDAFVTATAVKRKEYRAYCENNCIVLNISNPYERWLDETFPDELLDKVFPNMINLY